MDDSMFGSRDLRNYDHIRDPYTFDIPPPPECLPPAIRAWVEGRKERVSAWSDDYLEWHMASFRRTFACSRVRRQAPVEITEGGI